MKKNTVNLVMIVGVIAVVAILGLLVFNLGGTPTTQTVVTAPVVQNPGVGSNTNPSVNPVATYATVDKFSTTSVSGTSYYKRNGEPASSTSLSNVNPGVEYTYWVDNSSQYYVQPLKFTAGTLNNNVINKNAYQNTSVTTSMYDLVNRQTISNGVYNTTMAANGIANIEISYQGTAKKSAFPFGGVLVIEVNATMSSVTCTGDAVMSSNPYHVTYTVNQTQNKYVVFGIDNTLDTGLGQLKRINCQFQNGGSALKDAMFRANFIAANYYVTNAGEIVLDVEKYANDATTRTGMTAASLLNTAYWG